MSEIRDIREMVSLAARRDLVRIPPDLDVPLTRRVRRIIDAAAFRRLARISQLGLVSLVYPAAIHTRFEHSLGVYRLGLLFLQQLAHDTRFRDAVRGADAEMFIAASLLHDLGHWPFCHPLEDMHLASVPRHEKFASGFILEGEVADALSEDWGIDPREVVQLLSDQRADLPGRILASMLSGPIDIDKMDYLYRDSLHAGVPYGRNFDQSRLIASLCLNESGNGLALTDKGKTAAELMVFARYVMFSEVYWHHGVRAATAMFQRAFYLLVDRVDHEKLFRLTEAPMIAELLRAAQGEPGARELLDGLFGPTRRLHKRVIQCSPHEHQELYRRLARRPYPWLAACAARFAQLAGDKLASAVAAHEVLFDAPPIESEVQFNVDIRQGPEHSYRPLAEVSPVVRALANEQFDDLVKRVRIFAHPRIAAQLRDQPDLANILSQAIDETN